MSGYIGQVQISGTDPVLIGSTLYGVCTTAASSAAKQVISTQTVDYGGKFINNHYNALVQGTTIHVKFTLGNNVTSGVTLRVGTINQDITVVGRCTCEANTIISFTLDENEHWVVNDNVDTDTTYTFGEGTTNGAFTVTPLGGSAQTVSVHGLGAGAYKSIITDIANNTASTDIPTAAAVAGYVQSLTGGIAGITGAMHFRGITSTPITDGGTEVPIINGDSMSERTAGDVVLYQQMEYVWTGSAWELLGDEGSYALKSSTDTITEVGIFTANTLPTLTVTDTETSKVTVTSGSAASLSTNNVSIPNITNAGSATTASVAAGVLTITLGSAPTIADNPIVVKEVDEFTANTPTVVSATTVTVGSASGWTAGSQASLSTNDTLVVVPNSNNVQVGE